MTTKEITSAKTSSLVAFYNKATGKSIKKFSSRKAAEAACAKFATPERKAATKATESSRHSFKPEFKIVVADAERAAKMHPTSRRYASFSLVGKAGTTVEKYIEKGGARLDLSKMVDLGIVRVIGSEAAAA
jgi:hypothetical protein